MVENKREMEYNERVDTVQGKQERGYEQDAIFIYDI
jgi:hypothetical protein